MVTAVLLLYWDATTWAACTRVEYLPATKRCSAFVLTFSSMPDIAALEAHLLPTLAVGSVIAATALLDSSSTIRSRTPFQRFVLADTNIVSDGLVHLDSLSCAQSFDVGLGKNFVTFELHAW
jgi:hypothetical protein